MSDVETEATEIRVAYPRGAHTFRRVPGEAQWVLALEAQGFHGGMPRVGPYDDAGVLRVVTAFLTPSPTGVPGDELGGERLATVESRFLRTLTLAAAALERCEVADDPSGAADEAASLLRQCVALDGSYVPAEAQ